MKAEKGEEAYGALRRLAGEDAPHERHLFQTDTAGRTEKGAHPITKFCARTRLQPEAGSCDLFGKPGRKP
jgi:hypothetical protein